MTVLLAEAAGIDGETTSPGAAGRLLHDIGKMGIPDKILQKGDLSRRKSGWSCARTRRLLTSCCPRSRSCTRLSTSRSATTIVDGTGYPRGLSGEVIPFVARLFAVVDIWDALSSDRVYREAWPRHRVLNHLRGSPGITWIPPRSISYCAGGRAGRSSGRDRLCTSLLVGRLSSLPRLMWSGRDLGLDRGS